LTELAEFPGTGPFLKLGLEQAENLVRRGQGVEAVFLEGAAQIVESLKCALDFPVLFMVQDGGDRSPEQGRQDNHEQQRQHLDTPPNGA